MRYTQEQKEETRARMIAAVGKGFRRRGYGGAGIDALAKEAGVTSGAFYVHFASKEEAFDRAVADGIAELLAGVRALQASAGDRWIERLIDFYLSDKRTCDLGEACALQVLSGEVGRVAGDATARRIYDAGVIAVAEAVADGLPGRSKADRRARAWALLSTLAGGVTLARALTDEKAIASLLKGVRQAALALGRGDAAPA